MFYAAGWGRQGLTIAMSLAGCGTLGCAAGGVHYSGRTQPMQQLASQVRELSQLPAGARVLGRAEARCRLAEPGALRDAPLSGLLCSEPLLRAALRKKAAEVGGDLLAEVECESDLAAPAPWPGDDGLREFAHCSAQVGSGRVTPRAVPETAPTLANVAPLVDEMLGDEMLGEAVLDAWRIYVDADLSPASPGQVRGFDPKFGHSRIVPRTPPFDRPLAEVRARCEEACDERVLQNAVVAGASHLGARHVVLQECTRIAGEVQCTGFASAPHL